MPELPQELQQLDTRMAELQDALSDKDWQRLGDLNRDIAQSFVEPVMAALEAGRLSPSAVQKRLTLLQAFCDQAEASAREAREEASKALQEVGRSRKAANTYARVSDGPSRD